MLQELAFMAHNAGRPEEGQVKGADIEWDDALKVIGEALGNDINLARDFLKYVDERAGLLVGQGEAMGLSASYRFAHRTFQEYLVGSYQLRLRDGRLVKRLQELSRQGEYWSLAVQLCGEELYYKRDDENRLLDLASMLCPSQVRTPEEARQVLWAGLFARLAGSEKIVANTELYGDGGDAFLNRLKECLVQALRSTPATC